MAGRKVLVTGVTGLVGNNVVRLLVERGDHVRVLARERSDPRPLDGLDVEIVRGDLREDGPLAAAVAGRDLVIHAAAQVHIGWTGLAEARAINVEGSRRVAHAARLAGCQMVHVSSVDALGQLPGGQASDEETPPVGGVPCPYVVTKRAAEQAVLEEVAQGLAAVIVNPGFMIGPWDWKPSSGRMLLQVGRGWGLCAAGAELLLRRAGRGRRNSGRRRCDGGRPDQGGPALRSGRRIAELFSSLANFCPGHRRHAADFSAGADLSISRRSLR